MLRASIDLGTNTCLLLLSDWDEKSRQVTRTVSDHSTVVRLGQGVDRDRELHPDAVARTLACLKSYSDKVKAVGLKPEQALCVATSQARDARNGTEFFSRVKAETGFEFQTITGDQEAQFTFLGGLLPGMKPEDHSVVDIGGGSTELMSSAGGLSIDVGSVRMTERFLKSDPVTDEEFWACQDSIDELLSKAVHWRETTPAKSQLVAVAGTATTLAAWHAELTQFDATRIDQVVLTRGDVHRMVEELKWRTVAERKEITGIEEGRADVLLAGSLILWRAMELLHFKECHVSSRGLRYGILNLGE
ncbi:MAG: Ppx/GppA family phosphatase [Methylotenera sp.]|nr:Ppx/GppA family phosphatase [Oligoflexia bacterium]